MFLIIYLSNLLMSYLFIDIIKYYIYQTTNTIYPKFVSFFLRMAGI